MKFFHAAMPNIVLSHSVAMAVVAGTATVKRQREMADVQSRVSLFIRPKWLFTIREAKSFRNDFAFVLYLKHTTNVFTRLMHNTHVNSISLFFLHQLHTLWFLNREWGCNANANAFSCGEGHVFFVLVVEWIEINTSPQRRTSNFALDAHWFLSNSIPYAFW